MNASTEERLAGLHAEVVAVAAGRRINRVLDFLIGVAIGVVGCWWWL
jgi:hypothetical protein